MDEFDLFHNANANRELKKENEDDVKTSVKNHNYLEYQLKLLKWLTIWPLDSENILLILFYRTVSVFRLVMLFLASVGQVIQIFYSPNLSKMSSAIDIATMTTSAMYKMYFVIVYQNYFKDLVNTINNNFFERPTLNIDKVQVENIGHRTLPVTNMKHWLRFVQLFTKTYIYSAICTLIVFGFSPLIESKEFITNSDEANKHSSSDTTKNVLLPLNAWLPFDVSWSPLYEFFFVIEFIPLVDAGLVYVIEDSFFFTMLWLVCGQFEILKDMLLCTGNKLKEKISSSYRPTEFSENSNTNVTDEHLKGVLIGLDENDGEEEMYSNLVHCIKHHQVLLKFLRDFEKLSQTLIIVDFLHAIISLSFALLHTTESGNIIEYIKMVSFVFICILHQFLNNFFGEQIIQQQLSIAEAAYNMPWENYSLKVQKTVNFMMTRAQTPIVLNGFKMYFLCYNTFLEFMKAMISYFMVLRQLQDDNN